MENDCDLLISGALGVVIPKVGVLQLDILVEDGKIKELRKDSTNVIASKRIDASGRYVIPGVIDPHSHYGVFTPIEQAARTESKSAAIGLYDLIWSACQSCATLPLQLLAFLQRCCVGHLSIV
mgnify:CR=1 FL=1